MSEKPVIMIGGANGVGKTTFANRLLGDLDIDHKIGTGFLRAIIKSETSRSNPDHS